MYFIFLGGVRRLIWVLEQTWSFWLVESLRSHLKILCKTCQLAQFIVEENGLRFSFCGNCSYVMFRDILSLRFLTIMGYFWQNTYKDEISTVIFCKNVEIWTMLRKQLCNIKETGREMGAYNASYILYDSLLFQYTMPYVNTMYYLSCSKMLILR